MELVEQVTNLNNYFFFNEIFFNEIFVKYFVHLFMFGLNFLLFGLFLLLFWLIILFLFRFVCMCKGLRIMFGESRLFVIDLKFLDFSS